MVLVSLTRALIRKPMPKIEEALTSALQNYITYNLDSLTGERSFNHAIHLGTYVSLGLATLNQEKRVYSKEDYLGVVQPSPGALNHVLNHISGQSFTLHYALVIDSGGKRFVLDPYLPLSHASALSIEDYKKTAYINWENAMLSVKCFDEFISL